jgi:CBS domain-containing protein
VVSATDVEQAVRNRSRPAAADLAVATPVLHAEQTLEEALGQLLQHHGDRLPVLGGGGQVVGWVTHRDVLHAYAAARGAIGDSAGPSARQPASQASGRRGRHAGPALSHPGLAMGAGMSLPDGPAAGQPLPPPAGSPPALSPRRSRRAWRAWRRRRWGPGGVAARSAGWRPGRCRVRSWSAGGPRRHSPERRSRSHWGWWSPTRAILAPQTPCG